MKYCIYCGEPMEDEDLFCMECGKKDKKKFKLHFPKIPSKVVWAVAAVGIMTILGVSLSVLVSDYTKKIPEISYSYKEKEKKVNIEYNAIDTIYPMQYNRMDSIITFSATSEYGDSELLIEVEIPGFTEKFVKKVSVSGQIFRYKIKPSVLSSGLNLSKARDTQISFSVTDTQDNSVIVKDTIPVRVMSKYDCLSYDPSWEMNTAKYNFACFMTPEDSCISKVKNAAIDWLIASTDGKFDMFCGYQNTGLFGENLELNTYYQVAAVQNAVSNLGVKYSMDPFSTSNLNQRESFIQHVQTPAETLANKQGLCVETALLMASTLESAGMHCFLLLPPGHCMVAVEAWEGWGEYYIVETTTLPSNKYDIKDYVWYMNHDQWNEYITTGYGSNTDSTFVIDCELAQKLDFVGISD